MFMRTERNIRAVIECKNEMQVEWLKETEDLEIIRKVKNFFEKKIEERNLKEK